MALAPRRLGRLASHLSPSGCAFSQEEQGAWSEYLEAGVKRAKELGNRGPIRFDADGKLAKEIQEKYWEVGFYVFENVMRPEELAEIQAEVQGLLENAPVEKGSKVDKHGRPVKYPTVYDFQMPHQSEGQEVSARIVGNLQQPLRTMDSALRLYGHPQLLRVAEAFNGPDFTPFNNGTIFNKEPGIGFATGWHQDGRTHWDENGKPGRKPENGLPPRPPGVEYPEDLGCHGFSFHGAFSDCNPEQCLWVLPGSHKALYTPHWENGKFQLRDSEGRVNYNVKTVFATSRDEQEIPMIPGAAPMIMNAGDVGIHNRSCLHGSFPNGSDERRVTMVFGFHNRRFVINQRSRNKVHSSAVQRYRDNGHVVDHRRRLIMDERHIHHRSKIIQVAIEARKQKYPDEVAYVYQPLQGEPLPEDLEAYRKDYSVSFPIDL